MPLSWMRDEISTPKTMERSARKVLLGTLIRPGFSGDSSASLHHAALT